MMGWRSAKRADDDDDRDAAVDGTSTVKADPVWAIVAAMVAARMAEEKFMVVDKVVISGWTVRTLEEVAVEVREGVATSSGVVKTISRAMLLGVDSSIAKDRRPQTAVDLDDPRRCRPSIDQVNDHVTSDVS